jgi:hypothetical protein
MIGTDKSRSVHLFATMQHQHPLFLGNQREFSFMTRLFVADDGDSSDTTTQEIRTIFNISVLRKETTRLALRAHKKIGKVATRIRAAEEQYKRLNAAIDASSSEEVDENLLQQLEDAPGVEQYKMQMNELQTRLKKLNWLEEQFSKSPLKSKKQLSVEEIQMLTPDGEQVVQIIHDLDISDDDSQKQKRVEENTRNRLAKAAKTVTLKQQPQQQGGRLPYRRYYTEKQVEIRVSPYNTFSVGV